MRFPWALARLLPSAVRVRIRSRSTSARPPSTASIKRPVRVLVSAHGSASDRNSALASTIRLMIPNRSKVPCASDLLAVDVPAAASGGLELVKLAVEGLPVGRDAGIADQRLFGNCFSHILRQLYPLIGKTQICARAGSSRSPWADAIRVVVNQIEK